MTFLFLLLLFSGIMIISSIMVIFCKNPVHSVLFLILVFFNATSILLMVGLDFLAMIFLIIYVGAIAVLFLFVVMMLNIKAFEMEAIFYKGLPMSIFIVFIWFFTFILSFFVNYEGIDFDIDVEQVVLSWDWLGYFYFLNVINNLGMILFTYYYIYYIICGFILLVSMVSSIILTVNKISNVRRQEIFKQLRVNFKKLISNKKIGEKRR